MIKIYHFNIKNKNNMKLQNQVCTIEQGKRLKKLGLCHMSPHFVWIDNAYDRYVIVPLLELEDDGEGNIEYDAPAYTVAELGAALPTGYGTQRLTDDVGEEFFRAYDDSGNEIMGCDYEFEAQSRAAMITRLLETGTLTASEVNERTNNA